MVLNKILNKEFRVYIPGIIAVWINSNLVSNRGHPSEVGSDVN